MSEHLSRRHFLELMGASIALASGCTRMPREKIFPYVSIPGGLIPGIPRHYATAGSLSGYARDALAESHEGRPTKLEGNPRHPSSLGKSDIFLQADLLQLYDPDRAQSVLRGGQPSTWDAFVSEMLIETARWKETHGAGVRILSGRITSPTLLDGLSRFLKTYREARWHAYEPVGDELTREATRLAYGSELDPVYDFSRAELIVSLDSDFLGPGPGQVLYARQFIASRRELAQTGRGAKAFNRLCVVESSLTLTGACADHRFAARPSEVPAIARELARELGLHSGPPARKWVQALSRELLENHGRALLACGDQLPAETQALCFAINERLGARDRGLRLLSPMGPTPASLSALVSDLEQGDVGALLILGANPVYDAPVTLQFEHALRRAPLTLRLGLYRDETAEKCTWCLPESHFLETWGDGRTLDGIITLQQPLIEPLYQTRSALEVLAILNRSPGASARNLLSSYWTPKGVKLEAGLQDGFIHGFELPVSKAKLRAPLEKPAKPVHRTLEASFRPDPTLWDGRYANNAWLQELPKPLLQLSWGNAIVMGPDTARRLGLSEDDEVEVKIEGRSERGSILPMPGHPEGSLTLYLGSGRTNAGRVGNGHGYNAYALRSHRSPGSASGVELRRLGHKSPLATVRDHHSMEGRDLAVQAEVSKFLAGDILPRTLREETHTLLPPRPSKDNAWGMVIDLTSCIGCKTCTIACQAENNIPVVGKEEVRNAREMHWIRVDRYFEGSRTIFQPVPCMHCETAPCELVCPTVATNHSSDGLNQMVYNRCVGTRYCSNNCPYKVRRFNFFQYSDFETPLLQLAYNPEVTVRSRGVMEKCTYCIQRIQSVRIEAEKENRRIKDLEVLTACQQACPTDAITFGDLNDPASKVASLRKRPQNYNLLHELGTKPRTTYLARLGNPSPALEGES
jgi:molybdopterin-containing oxidoreductase family iron-sulfur binding subunit